MCTLNLHQAQHLARQARAREPLSWDAEFFVERMIADSKRITRHTVSTAPEATIARFLLDNAALDELAATADVKTFDQLIPAFRAAPLTGKEYDQPADNSMSSFLHKGHRLDSSERQSNLAAVAAYIASNEAESEWADMQINDSQLLKYTAAQRGNRNTIHSKAHVRSSKASYNVTVHRRLTSGRYAVHMAEVQYFLLVAAAEGDRPPLRLAMCKLFAEQQNPGVRAKQQADLKAWQRAQPGYQPSEADRLADAYALARKEGMFRARGNAIWKQAELVDIDALGSVLMPALPPGDAIFGMNFYGASKGA